MAYPELQIDRQKLIYNARTMLDLCRRHNVRCQVVTKAVVAYPPIVDALLEAGVTDFADSRLDNMRRLEGYGESRMLLRIPMRSEAADVVRHADVSLNSEYDVLCALSDAALTAGVKHGVILMVELGDLREGVMPDDLLGLAEKTLALRGLKLVGVGANFNCYGGIIGDEAKLNDLVALASAVETRFDIRLPIVSGGNSGLIYLLEDGRLPEGVTHLRIGEGLWLGVETSYGQRIMDLYTDVFTLKAEIVELKSKPSQPYGTRGKNALGEMVSFPDVGTISRAIVALGQVDVGGATLRPKARALKVLGASTDHFILDVTHAVVDLAVGDVLEFDVDYKTLNYAMLSPYVHKRLI